MRKDAEDIAWDELESRLLRQEQAKRRLKLIELAKQAGFEVDQDDVYAPAAGRFGLDPRIEVLAKLIAPQGF
jgi:hypothetical protein